MATPTPIQRHALLRVLLPKNHRFRSLRSSMALLSIVLVAVVPLLGLGGLDLWRGHHRAFGHPTTFGKGLLAALLFGVASYLVTFVVNAVGGRLFCGFGCPLAQANRLDEKVRALKAAKVPDATLQATRVKSFGLAALFAGAVLLWWVDPHVFVDGSAVARAAALGSWLAVTLLILLHARFWNWAFCRGWCPVGLYYSVVTPSRRFGLVFDAAARSCIECNACDRICPVGLAPRDLDATVERDEGLALAQASGLHHCLSCGDCIEACEFMVGRKGIARAPLLFGRAPRHSPCAGGGDPTS